MKFSEKFLIRDVIMKENIASIQYFLCQCIDLFLSKHHFTFFNFI